MTHVSTLVHAWKTTNLSINRTKFVVNSKYSYCLSSHIDARTHMTKFAAVLSSDWAHQKYLKVLLQGSLWWWEGGYYFLTHRWSFVLFPCEYTFTSSFSSFYFTLLSHFSSCAFFLHLYEIENTHTHSLTRSLVLVFNFFCFVLLFISRFSWCRVGGKFML